MWRISYAIINEAGPYQMLARFRERFSDASNYEDGGVSIPAHGVLGCIYCLSFWVALVHLVLPVKVCLPFAMSAVAIAFNRWREDG